MTEQPAGEQKPRPPRQPKTQAGENVDQAVTDEQKANNNRNRNKNRNRNNKRGGAEGATNLEESKDEPRPQTAPAKKNYNNDNKDKPQGDQ